MTGIYRRLRMLATHPSDDPVDGEVPFDMVLIGTDPKVVKAELDVY